MSKVKTETQDKKAPRRPRISEFGSTPSELKRFYAAYDKFDEEIKAYELKEGQQDE